MRKVDVAIIGAGHAGLNAVKQVRNQTDNWVLINGGELGTTCARVGCMPSKAIIELASNHCQRVGEGKSHQNAAAHLLEEVRDYRDIFVDLVLANTTDNMEENTELLNGYATFLEPDVLKVNEQIIKANRIIVATGSKPVIPKEWLALGDRLLTSDTLFELDALPESVAVIGLGYVGLEMGQALHRLGVKVIGFNRDEFIAGICDASINQEAINIFSKEFPIHLGAVARLKPEQDGVRVIAGDVSVYVEKVFVAIGRTPNIPDGLSDFCETDHRGVPVYDEATLKINDLPVYVAGDATGQRMMLQDASREGGFVGETVLADDAKELPALTPMSIACTNPNICHVGAKLEDIIDPVIGEQRFGPIGRALIMRNNRGLIRLYADPVQGRLLGACMVGPRVEHLAHLVSWAIQQNLTVDEILQMPFYHPVIEEALQDALKVTAKKLKQRFDQVAAANMNNHLVANA